MTDADKKTYSDKDREKDTTICSFLADNDFADSLNFSRWADSWIRGLLVQKGLPEYEWTRPITYSPNLAIILSLQDIKKGAAYVDADGLSNLNEMQVARLVVERITWPDAPPIHVYSERRARMESVNTNPY